MKKLLLLSILVMPFLTLSSQADETYSNPEARVVEKYKTVQTWDGKPFVYPDGTPEVTVVDLEIDDGFNTGYHCHPVVSIVHVLKGELQIQLYNGPKKVFKAGEMFTEVVDTWHSGEAINGDVEALIYYIGNKEDPLTILPKTDDLTQKCAE
ncbi:MAG: cupin domain-containing protein [Thermodesulfobacteriota bacterium]